MIKNNQSKIYIILLTISGLLMLGTRFLLFRSGIGVWLSFILAFFVALTILALVLIVVSLLKESSKTKPLIVYIILLITSGLLMLGTGVLLYRRGIVRDEFSLAFPEPFFAGMGVWLSFIMAFALTILALVLIVVSLLKESSKTKPVIIYCISLLVFAFCITSIACTILNQQQWIKRWNELYAKPKITSISLNELHKQSEEKDFKVIYVGRDDCRACQEAYHQIGRFAKILFLEIIKMQIVTQNVQILIGFSREISIVHFSGLFT